MRVLFVSSGRNGRPGTVVFSQGESLRAAGITVDYLLAGPRLSGYLAAIPKIRRAWRSGRYDLVHAHYSLSAFAASFSGGFPLVVSLMGSDVFMSGPMRLVIKILCRYRWGATIVKSEQMKEKLKIPESEVIPNGVDTGLFVPVSRVTAKEHIGFPVSRKMVLFGSSADRPEKNPDLAQRAFDILDDPTADFRYLSGIEHSEVLWHLNAADVLLLTSAWEGSPNVIKEAMACNCPVVSSDSGDVAMLTGGTEGCYIALHDAEDVAGKLREALDFSGRTRGRERILELGLDSGAVAGKIKAVYERVVS